MTSSSSSTERTAFVDTNLPASPKIVSRRDAFPVWNYHESSLYAPRPRRTHARPVLPIFTSPGASTSTLPSAIGLVTSETAESQPFLLSSMKKPVFVPLTSTKDDSNMALSTPKALVESSYILPEKTPFASQLAISATSVNPGPKRVYSRVFYPHSGLSETTVAPPPLALNAPETVCTPTTPRTSKLASVPTATLTQTSSTKRTVQKQVSLPPGLDKVEESGKDKLATPRDELDLAGSISCESKWHTVGSADNTGSTHASSFDWQPANADSDSDSGWEISEFQFAAHSDWSDGDFGEEPQQQEPEEELAQSPQSLYFDAPEMGSSDSDEDGGGKDEDDGYAGDSEAIPHSRTCSKSFLHLDDDLDASGMQHMPLGTIRDRKRMRMAEADD